MMAVIVPGNAYPDTDSNIGRHTGIQSGTVLVNGLERNSRYMKRISGYVLDSDLLFPNLTVRETLEDAVELRLDSKISSQEKKMRVNQTLKDLELTHVADTRVGGDDERASGLSGGQV